MYDYTYMAIYVVLVPQHIQYRFALNSIGPVIVNIIEPYYDKKALIL